MRKSHDNVQSYLAIILKLPSIPYMYTYWAVYFSTKLDSWSLYGVPFSNFNKPNKTPTTESHKSKTPSQGACKISNHDHWSVWKPHQTSYWECKKSQLSLYKTHCTIVACSIPTRPTIQYPLYNMQFAKCNQWVEWNCNRLVPAAQSDIGKKRFYIWIYKITTNNFKLIAV